MFCGCHSYFPSGFVVSHSKISKIVKFFHAALHVCWIKVMSVRGYVFIGRPHMHMKFFSSLQWYDGPLGLYK